MADMNKRIAQLGAVDLLTLTQALNDIISQHEEAKDAAWRLRMPKTEYKTGDKVIVPGVGNFDKVLRCENAGTTAETAFPKAYDALNVGEVIQDGTVAWSVVNLVTIPDIDDAPVTSVNGKTGDVNLTAQTVGAEPEGAVSNHNDAEDAHAELFEQHRAENATDTASGHVKVDGLTIIAADGVISSVGGLAIGSVFAYPAAIPPEGAYLLNGQTITNCRELYPKFWEWVIHYGARKMNPTEYNEELAATGVCGGFVLDTVTGSVRLPSVVNGTLWGASDANIGASLAAGLPNITGQFETAGVAATTTAKGAFTQVNHGNLAFGSGSNAMGGRTFTFDASGSSSVYGNSDTVQPPAIRVSWCVQVYNAATALSEQDSAQLASQMQMKAQTDLANVNSNIDFVVESWSDGAGGWYRKYRSGWVEQGGIVPDTGGAKAETITFWVEMQNTNYTPKSTQTSNASSGSSSGRSVSCYNLTETGMDCYIFDTSTQGIRWEVKGYAATE